MFHLWIPKAGDHDVGGAGSSPGHGKGLTQAAILTVPWLLAASFQSVLGYFELTV